MDEVRERVISPMTTWLLGDRSRHMECRKLLSPDMGGDLVWVGLWEQGKLVGTARGQSVEEANANALNKLMAEQAEA